MRNNFLVAKVDFYPIIAPILEVLNAILWPMIAVVVAVGSIYCIVLGVKIAKCDEQNSREKAKKDLIGAIIGFVIIFVLVVCIENRGSDLGTMGKKSDLRSGKT